jgi:hypothetical protein
MLRLIKANSASTGKPYLRDGTPPRFLNFGARDAFRRQGRHFGFQIVAQEIQFVGAALLRWVERGFCRRQTEDQPAAAHIHGFQAQYAAEKCAVRLGVFALDNYVSARNHLLLPRNARNYRRVA